MLFFLLTEKISMNNSLYLTLPVSPVVVEIIAPLERIDLFLTTRFKNYSRNFFQKTIEDGLVTINGKVVTKASQAIKTGDILEFTKLDPAPLALPHPAPLYDLRSMLIAETPDFLIINKPAGLVVHKPHERSLDLSLVDLLVGVFPEIAQVGPPERPGIVHRLDKDTSGLLIVARTSAMHILFTDLFKNRRIQKKYYAVVQGETPTQGTIEYPISRHAAIPYKMTCVDSHGRAASTHYTALNSCNNSTLLELRPTTGRTHQLRVHCAAIGHPIVGDFLYGSASKLIKRQALHAESIAFIVNGQEYSYHAELPLDFRQLLEKKELSIFRRSDRPMMKIC